jgi:hypothetical protein
MSFFKTFDEFKEFVPVSLQLDPQLKKLLPQSLIAESQYLVPEIGSAFIEELREAYTNNTETIFQATARNSIQALLANFTIALFIPKHKIQVDSQGIRVTENEANKDAKPHDTAEGIKAYERDGWILLENLMVYLEANASAFPTWAASPESTIFSNALIKTTKDLEQYTGIRVSRRLFKKIQPHIHRHETKSLVAITGLPLYVEWLDQLKTNSVSPANAVAIPDAMYMVSHGALLDSLAVLDVEFGDDGITVASNTSNSNQVRTRVAATEQRLVNTVAHCEKIFTQYQGSLQKTLQELSSSLPLFVSDGAYKEPYTGKRNENPPNSKVIRL